MSVKSMMQAPSFKPELEFEVLKLVLLREKYLQKLLLKLQQKKGKVDMTIIGTVDVLRDCSVEIVETIQTWERTQIAYPNIKPFTWNGQNYLTKMCEDLSFLINYPEVQSWLGFSTQFNPFLVPPEILLEGADYSPHSFIVFGSKPAKLDPFHSHSSHHSHLSQQSIQSNSYNPSRQTKKKSYLNASLNPYMTPIVNDPHIVATQSKMNKAFKTMITQQQKLQKKGKLNQKNGKEEKQQQGKRQQGDDDENDDDDEENNLDLAPSDFFESYLSYEMVMKIQKCWNILEHLHPQLYSQFLSTNSFLNPSFVTGTLPSHGLEMESSLLMTRGDEEGAFNPSSSYSQSNRNLTELQIPGLKLGSLPWSPLNSQSLHQINSSILLPDTTGPFSLDPTAQPLPLLQLSQQHPPHESKSELFQSSLDETALPIPVHNETLRRSAISSTATATGMATGTGHEINPTLLESSQSFHSTEPSHHHPPHLSFKLSESTYNWTPHEIALQKVVQKRGGELYILTAASTKGRMKAPYRKNRYLRLITDLEHVEQQITLLEMNREEYLSWLSSDHCPSLTSLTGKYLSNLLLFHGNNKDLFPSASSMSASSASASLSSPSQSKSQSKSQSLSRSSLESILPFVLNDLKLSLQTLKGQHHSLKYLLHTFETITTGNMKDISRLKSLQTLSDGEVLSTDEHLSSQLEHQMAYKIQSFFIRILAQSRRQKLFELQSNSVKKIQTAYRLKRGKEQFIQSVKIIRYQNLVKKINERLLSCARYLGLKLETKRRNAVKLIQQVWRGYRSRGFIFKKRLFFKYIFEVQKAAEEMTPGLIEGLIEELGEYIYSYNYIIPVEIITLLRGLLYTLNNENPEVITIIEENKGSGGSGGGSGGGGGGSGGAGGGVQYDTKELYGSSLHWYDSIKFLRRKGRLLRRLRALAAHIALPNAYPLHFTKDTIHHLSHLTHQIPPTVYRHMKSKKILNLFYQYVTNLYLSYTLHTLFPEYYGVSTPLWYREILNFKYFQNENFIYERVTARCYENLQLLKQQTIKEGKKFGHINCALTVSYHEMNLQQKSSQLATEKFQKYFKKTILNEKKKLQNLNSFKDTIQMGLEVARRDLNEYLLVTEYPNEKELQKLYFKIDEKFILLNSITSELLNEGKSQELNEKLRDFESILHNYDQNVLEGCCERLGVVLSHLMINKGRWEEFIESIGGLQFLPDIEGEMARYYEELKGEIMRDLEERRELLRRIQRELKEEINELKRHGYEIRSQRYEEMKNWDEVYLYIKQSEKEEDIECAKRDNESSDRKLKQPNPYTIPADVTPIEMEEPGKKETEPGKKSKTEMEPGKKEKKETEPGKETNQEIKQKSFSFQTVLLLIDIKIPKKVREYILKKLFEYNYVTCETLLQGMDFKTLLPKIQHTIDQHLNSIIFIEKGLDHVHRSEFNASFQTALLSLYPSPKVMCIDGTYTLTTVNWYTSLSPFQSSMKIRESISEPPTPQLLLGKIRYLVGLFEYGHRIAVKKHIDPETNKPYPTPYSELPPWLPELFLKDYQQFLQFLHYSQNYPNIIYPITTSQPPPTSFNSNYTGQMPFTSQYISQQWHEGNTGHTPSYVVLASVISAILNLWTPPLTEWRGVHYRLGLQSFLSLATSMPTLLEKLRLSPYPLTTPISWKQIELVMNLTQIWQDLQTVSFYSHPVLYLLTHWTLTVSLFFKVTYELGGTVPVVENSQSRHAALINSTIELDWNRDVLSSQQHAIVGEILHQTFQNYIIYHNTQHPTTVYYIKSHTLDTMTQMTIKKTENYNLTIYYLPNSDNIYLKIIIPLHDSQGRNQIYYTSLFFCVTVKRFISSLQPNSTEIYEGRIPKFEFESESFNWIQLLAEWTRLILPKEGKLTDSDVIIIQNSRCQYLQLSLIGLINGYSCRIEVYEECYGDIVMSIYGLHEDYPLRAVYVPITEEIYKTILFKSDLEEERIYLENYDATMISSIFIDRLVIYPSQRMARSLQEKCGLSPTSTAAGMTTSGRKNITKKIKFRVVGGPGRMIGQKIIKLYGCLLVITVYEIHNNQEISPLRIRVYDQLTSQCLEFKISSLERVILFNSNDSSNGHNGGSDGTHKKSSNLFQQIVSKLKYIRFDVNNIPIFPVLYIQHHDSFLTANQYGLSVNEREKSYEIITPSNYSMAGTGAGGGAGGGTPGASTTATTATTTTGENQKYFNGIIFDRTISSQQFGQNLLVGSCICHPFNSFVLTCTDTSSCVQVNVLIKYQEMVPLLTNEYNDLEEFVEEMNRLNDGDTVLDILDEVMDCIQIDHYDGSRRREGGDGSLTSSRSGRSDEDEGEGEGEEKEGQRGDKKKGKKGKMGKKRGKETLRESDEDEDEDEEESEDGNENESNEDDEGKTSATSVSLIPTNHYPVTYQGPCLALIREEDDGGPVVLACLKESSQNNLESNPLPTTMIQQTEKSQSLKIRVYRAAQPVYVTSKLTEKQLKWSHFFSGAKERLKYLNQVNSKLIQPRQTLIHAFLPRKLSLNPFLITTTTANPTQKKQLNAKLSTPPPTTLVDHNILQYIIESSYIYEGILKKNEHASARICWRSRMLPKQFLSTENSNSNSNSKMLLKRSARVIKLMRVEEMCVVEEPIYLHDEEGAVEENLNYLPVIILEILSENSGCVHRHYRIQVMANNGEKLGEADIVNDEDLKLVLGYDMRHLLECDVEDRNMREIFQYIINERIVINLLNLGKKITKSGRREGMRMENKDPSSATPGNGTGNGTGGGTGGGGSGSGSVVLLQRDSSSLFQESDESTSEDENDSDLDSNLSHNLSERYPSSRSRWLRIYSTCHRISGRGFRTVVILTSSKVLLTTHSNIYFQRNSVKKLFETNELNVIFNCNDLNGKKKTIRLFIRGKDLWRWLPTEVQETVKLSTTVKREKFGKWLCEQLRIQYNVIGEYVLELYGMSKDKTRDQKVIEYHEEEEGEGEGGKRK